MTRYLTPVYDRTLADVTAKTSKGYFNVADWTRIYGNAEVVKTLVDLVLSISVTFDTVPTPTVTTIPTVTQLNTLLANIERLRIAADLPPITGLVEVKDDWIAGYMSPAPNYADANTWERVLSIIYNNVGEDSGYTGWIPPAASPTRRARTGVAITGSGMDRNNGFRRNE